MLKLIAGVLFLGLPLLASSQGVGIGSGGSYNFEFSSLSFIRPAIVSDGGQLSVNFITDGLGPGESLMLELFPDALTDTPLAFNFNGATGGPFPDGSLGGVAIFWSPGTPAVWPDLQGVVRVTMNSGSVQISSFAVTQVASDGYYSQTFPVPEPTGAALVLIGVGALVVTHLGSKKQARFSETLKSEYASRDTGSIEPT